jgi:hypothetical protein
VHAMAARVTRGRRGGGEGAARGATKEKSPGLIRGFVAIARIVRRLLMRLIWSRASLSHPTRVQSDRGSVESSRCACARVPAEHEDSALPVSRAPYLPMKDDSHGALIHFAEMPDS